MKRSEANRKIAIYCNFLQPGGVERVSVRLQSILSRNAYPAELYSYNGDELFGIESAAASALPSSGILVFSRKKDLADLKWRFLSLRKVYWRHIPLVGESRFMRALDGAFIVLMSWIGVVVCVCDELKDQLRSLPMIRKDSVISCFSPIGKELVAFDDVIPVKPIEQSQQVELVYFGREGAQKRLDDVLALAREARNQGLDIRLSIYGYQQIDRENAFVVFHGKTDDPISQIATADGLILISEYEGFPTALMEAAQCGLPIFCNQFSTGLQDFERIVGPTNRIDPKDLRSLSSAIQKLEPTRYNLKDFQDSAILSQWSSLFDEM